MAKIFLGLCSISLRVIGAYTCTRADNLANQFVINGISGQCFNKSNDSLTELGCSLFEVIFLFICHLGFELHF